MSVARNFDPWQRALCAWLIACLAFGAAFLSAFAPANAQEAQFGDEKIAVDLFADGAPVAGAEWMLALRFTPETQSGEEWHGYWSNPGDAGQGMELSLNLPDGWEQGEALYPVPQTFVQPLEGSAVTNGGLMNHIYKGAYTVLVPVQVPQDADVSAAGAVTGFVRYLACSDILCVPQDAKLIARPPSKSPSQFPRWRAQIAPLLDAEARFVIDDTKLRLAVPLPESVTLDNPHAFIANTQLVQYNAAQIIRRTGDWVTVEIPLSDWPKAEDTADRAAPVAEVSGILAFNDGAAGGAGLRFVAKPSAKPSEVPSGGTLITSSAPSETPAIPLLILAALAGGLILNIMPCVFPILSIKALALAKAGGEESTARSDALAYTAGVVIACVALGGVMLLLRAGGEQVGWAFQLQSPGVVAALLVLAVVITVNFAGLFELPQLSVTGGSGKTGSFATGLLAAFVATPCTGPFMAAALGAALLLPPLPALMLFAALGLGLALPFLALGFIPALRRKLPKPGAWMERFRRIMAIPMALTVLALVWLTVQLGGRPFALIALLVCAGIVIALGVVGRLQRAGKMAWPAFGLIAAPFLLFGAFAMPASYAAQTSDTAASSIHDPREYSADALAEARASGQPVFLWFTADWCVTCKVNESVAIEREEVRAAFEEAGVITMVGDWTMRDEAIGMFIAEQGAAGVPLYLWYDPQSSGEQLPQVLTSDMLIERAEVPAGDQR